MDSFSLNPDATTHELYKGAESFCIIEPSRNTVLWEDSGRVIPDDSSMMLMDILPPSSSPKIPPHAMLTVFNVDQIMLTVHIINGLKMWSFTTHCGMTVADVYQQAVRMGIMENADQFMLQYDNDQILGLYADPEAPAILLDAIDPFHPQILTLFVSPVPEGLLLFAMFRDMAPNQDIPFWEYARFCRDNPWHELCSSLSRMMEFHKEFQGNLNVDDMMESIVSRPDEETGQWNHDIYVDTVPSWSGQLNLAYLPRTVRSLCLKGINVSLSIKDLRQSSLKELELQFQKVIGISVAALTRLTGSQLEILRLPTAEVRESDVEKVLEILNHSKGVGLIELELIEFAGGKWVVYDSDNEQYIFRK